ncbi:host nuclease inhibitor protein [Salmonella enterica subsp. enterica]|uniref:Host nuclease inhibitor protein n=1 Tax=Salmonella enterica subsp. enterica serovar Java TaxID=224729 RepID=A0A5U8K118_SALEB|nr:host nuclease inhibitor protein [Salmonella enterica subsp. enterica serovar Stanley]EAA8946661.1 host nuclease inhibitor protein [Salmonella enterica]EAB8111504.1 host nuclease inhibitor protein [Salmonella enterica subsp. enterica serovar Typhimurium]EBG9514154.1 host nuclease inhibitor protein [Salmonella enterica subsp. enterica serovar Gaminara]EBH3493126.1 host nuclease inhibitor protein [Salmonella enterica subsp. enterica serovar Kentucky]EBR8572710.1 host nuclease inhibitor protein
MKPTITAYCWASGLIEFGNTLPEGALPIVTGNEKNVRDVVGVLARHAYNGDLLVPGIPETANQNEAREALVRFSRVIQERLKHPNKRKFK